MAGVKTASLTLAAQNQNIETVQRIVAGIIGKSGCNTCGRMIKLDMVFGGDPDPELAKSGVVSIQTEGF